jgi:hypothetical protein
MAAALEAFDELKAALKKHPQGSSFELNFLDMLDLAKLRPTDLMSRGYDQKTAQKVSTALLEHDEHSVGPLGESLGVQLKVSHDAKPLLQRIAELGDEIYRNKLPQLLEEGNRGKILAVDVGSGEYAIDRTALAASDALRKRNPNAVAYCVRIGERTLRRIGARPKRVAP